MQPKDDLTWLERQLAACLPSAAGLDADAMLFAAGQAAASPAGRTRLVWPAAAAGFAAVALGLGTALVSERSERLAPADRLSRQTAVIAATTTPPVAPLTVAPDSYLAIRQQVEQGDYDWLVHADNGTAAPPVPPPEPAILRASSRIAAELPY